MTGLAVALLSRHTSPLAQPGGGNAGGMNTYVLRSALALSRLGVRVEMATAVPRAADVGVLEVAEGVRLHRLPVTAGHRSDRHVFEGFGEQVLDALPRCDVVHGHYWQSGLAGLVVARAWQAPLLQSAHTLARVKNGALAPGQHPESTGRIDAEAELAAAADLLIANTHRESDELIRLYHADPERVRVIEPGVDTEVFTPVAPTGWTADSERRRLRSEVGLPVGAVVVAFVGRLQKLKAPEVLLQLAAPLREILAATGNDLAAESLALLVCGAPAGADLGELDRLRTLADRVPPGIAVRFVPPRPPDELAALYRAVDVVVVPSRSESFGLVALEAEACGTPVVAAHVGGLPRALGDGAAGVLVRGHDPARWAGAVAAVLRDPTERARLRSAGPRHAAGFTWARTAGSLLEAYTDSRLRLRQARRASPPRRSA